MKSCCIKKSCRCQKKNHEEIAELIRRALEQSNRVLSSKIVNQTDEVILVQQQIREIREILLELCSKLIFN